MKKILLVSDDSQMQINLNAALYRFNIRIVRFENLSELKEDYYNGNRYIFKRDVPHRPCGCYPFQSVCPEY